MRYRIVRLHMNKKTRLTIFYVFLAIFLFLGAYLLLLTRGLVIDFKHLRLVKTGGIFLKFEPTDAKIEINQKNYKSSASILTNGTLIKNLLPGKYDVKISEDGYKTWEKEIDVESGIVSSARYINLWPTNYEFEQVTTSSITDFWITSEGIITKENDKTLVFDSKPIRGVTVISSSNKSSQIITKDANGTLFFIDTISPNTAINVQEIFNSLKKRENIQSGNTKISNAYIHPFSQNKIIVTTQSDVYIIDTKKVELEKLIFQKQISNLNLDDNVLTVQSKNDFFIINLLLKTTSSSSISSSTEYASIKKIGNGGVVILTMDKKGNLVSLNETTGKTNLIASSTKNFFVSKDKKIVFVVLYNNKINLHYLENELENTKLIKGTTSNLNLELAENQDIDVVWLDKFQKYALLKDGQKLSIIEIDSRKPCNSSEIAGEIKKFELDKNDNLIILGKNGSLKKLEL